MLDSLSEKFSDAFRHIRGQSKISESNIEETLKEVKTALLEADVNFKVVKKFINDVKEKALGEKVVSGVRPGEQFVKIMHDELSLIMGEKNEELNFDRPAPFPFLIVGLNGAGKTTFSAKFSKYLNDKKKKNVLLVPCDTFRPAAKDQLITLAKSAGLDYFDSDLSQSPDKIAQAAMEYAKEQKKDLVIVDTAGRLHIDQELMSELQKVKAALPQAETLLVADAMTGQEAVNVAQSFHEAVGLTGTVLSKMDSDARGGAALSIRQVTKVPIRFISTGEKLKDLELFHPDRLAGRILDMGDVLTLVEKAQEVVDEKEAEKLMKKMEKNEFTMEDFMKQMKQLKKLGSMESLMKMIPGMGGAMRQMGDLSPAEDEMKKMQSMIDSMTIKERQNHKILNKSRKERIAKGSGHEVNDVNQFVSKFEQMKKMMSGMLSQKGLMESMMGGGGMPSMEALGGMGKKKKKKGGKGPWGRKYF